MRPAHLIGWIPLAGLLSISCSKKTASPLPDIAAPAESAQALHEAARCAPISNDPPFVLGPEDMGRTKAADAGSAEQDILPFATEVGDGVAWSGGFAVGAMGEGKEGLAFSVVTLGPDGKNAKVIPLGMAHGDVEPPRLAARGSVLLAGLLEPEPNGRLLRLAKIEDGNVTWGASLHERGGESQAFDIGVGDKKGIVVWDEDGPNNSTIQMSVFDATSATGATLPRAVSPSSIDAESPRLAARPSGYWLAFIGRGAADVDTDARYVAEDIGVRWIEVAALDANGAATGATRAVTPKDGHVMVFDMAPAPDGGALIVYRNDDTPSGGGGGEVMRVVVRPGSVEPPAVLMQGDVGAGVPSLVDRWLAVLDAADTTRLAPVNASGELAAPLTAEPAIGSGEPVAGGPAGLLVVRPAGRAVKLSVVSCSAPVDGDR